MKSLPFALLFFTLFIVDSHAVFAQTNKKAKVKIANEVPANAIVTDELEPVATDTNTADTTSAAPVIKPKSEPPKTKIRKKPLAPPKAEEIKTESTSQTSSTPQAAVTAIPTPIPAKPSPWKLAYLAEYYGPRLGKSLDKTFSPGEPYSSEGKDYAYIDHGVKAGYKLNSTFSLGVQARGSTHFDPTSDQFTFKNFRGYATWGSMIENPWISMSGALDIELPTTDDSRNKGMIIAFNIKNFWTFKTPLRNWSFSVMTFVRPSFYNDPSSSSDLYLILGPNITVDLFPNWQFQLDGGFDASHAYSDTYFDFGPADYDHVDIGPIWSINGNFQLTPNLRFYADNTSFKAATLYIAFSAAL